MTYSIFASLNSSDLLWSAIIPTFFMSTLLVVIADFIYTGISKSCQVVKARTRLINAIPLMTVKQLRQLAKSEGINIRGIRLKAHLQNVLMDQLA